MQKVIITGVPPYDGEYEIPMAGYTNGELHRIKQISGVRAGELPEAAAAGDMGVMVAMIAIILERNGKTVQLQLLWDATEDQFEVVKEDDARETEERPLDSPDLSGTAGGSKSSSDGVPSEHESEQSSGDNGEATGDLSRPIQSPTGSLGSEPVESSPTTSQS